MQVSIELKSQRVFIILFKFTICKTIIWFYFQNLTKHLLKNQKLDTADEDLNKRKIFCFKNEVSSFFLFRNTFNFWQRAPVRN